MNHHTHSSLGVSLPTPSPTYSITVATSFGSPHPFSWHLHHYPWSQCQDSTPFPLPSATLTYGTHWPTPSQIQQQLHIVYLTLLRYPLVLAQIGSANYITSSQRCAFHLIFWRRQEWKPFPMMQHDVGMHMVVLRNNWNRMWGWPNTNLHTHTYNLHTRYKSPSQYQTNQSSYIGPASCAQCVGLVGKAGKSKNAGMCLRTSEFLTVSKLIL